MKSYLRRALASAGRQFMSRYYGVSPRDWGPLLPHDEKTLEAAGRVIEEALLSTAPVFIARGGETELANLVRVRDRERFGLVGSSLSAVATGDPHFFVRGSVKRMELAGLLPFRGVVERQFVSLWTDAIAGCDVWASFFRLEARIAELIQCETVIPLPALEPFRGHPWTRALADMKVLVVHPFSSLIEKQYARRDEVFSGSESNLLPDFDLQTLKPRQAYLGEIPNAKNWFSELERLKKVSEDLDFDVALIGAGPLGMPLGSHIKKLGRKAVVIGGATQLLFGILGNRWRRDPAVGRLKNEAWVFPDTSARPTADRRVDKGAYW